MNLRIRAFHTCKAELRRQHLIRESGDLPGRERDLLTLGLSAPMSGSSEPKHFHPLRSGLHKQALAKSVNDTRLLVDSSK